MEYKLKIRKGLNIRLKGVASKEIRDAEAPDLFAIKPSDFHGIKPKVIAKPETKVKIGTPVFFDKNNPEVLFVSPISGTISEIVRGEKRRILHINIKNDFKNDYENLDVPAYSDSRYKIVEFFCKSGLWPFFKQRPYGVIAETKAVPKSIFISLHDTAPLAPDYDFLLEGKQELLINALKYIASLTNGKVYIGLSENSKLKTAFVGIDKINVIEISGPHPAGNVGTLINKFDPINKDEVVFTLTAQDLLHIANTINKGYFATERTIVLSGSEVKEPMYINTFLGAGVANIIDSQLTNDNCRIISGNVLTGTEIEKEGAIGFSENQICVIPEGNEYEMFGWILPGFKKFSSSRLYFSFLAPKKKYRINTNFHGGHRPFVMTGQYEKVCPLDILPQHLIKAIIVNDIDKMEQLGIYEVIEEDLALCEFVCTSKTEVQSILREGLDLMREEMS
jgi:Na+-transporting NADH:ubiquinone oxidoreductase subunit A